MISVIVPVCNVEPYLAKCLDSITGQTCRDLEILVIDDGSTDRSGKICDRYAEKDPRIRVFHMENRGLSAARNVGLDHVTGEYVGFVDSDDWIEPDMYEVLLRSAKETGADIVECGVYREYPNRTVEKKRQNLTLNASEAVKDLVFGIAKDCVWDKLWKRECFDELRFPEGRIYEDLAVTYKAFLQADKVVLVEDPKYHYLQRQNSLSNLNSAKGHVDRWLGQKERYDALASRIDKASRNELLRICAWAIEITWAYLCDDTKEQMKAYRRQILEMNAFTKRHFPLFGDKNWSRVLRLGIFLPHFSSRASFRAAWVLNRMHQRLKKDGDQA